jgi:hypothetical protein
MGTRKEYQARSGGPCRTRRPDPVPGVLALRKVLLKGDGMSSIRLTLPGEGEVGVQEWIRFY